MVDAYTLVPLLPRTRVTSQVMTVAADAGLRPYVQVDTYGRTVYRGTYRIVINGQRMDSPLGTVIVGATNGRILRASIGDGKGSAREYRGARQVLAAIRSLPRQDSKPTHVARVATLTDRGVEVCDFPVSFVEALTPDVSRVLFPDCQLHDVLDDEVLRPIAA